MASHASIREKKPGSSWIFIFIAVALQSIVVFSPYPLTASAKVLHIHADPVVGRRHDIQNASSLVTAGNNFHAQPALNTDNTCYKGDSDCPSCHVSNGTTTKGNMTRTSHVLISEAAPEFILGVRDAQKVIIAAGEASDDLSKDIISIENLFGLHTSLNYFCCHTQEEYQRIGDVIAQVEWEPIHLNYTTFGCNIDHNNVTIYMLLIPDANSQAQLLSLIRRIETGISAAGIAIRNPRKQPFHCTLARVTHEYPVDSVVAQLNAYTSTEAQHFVMRWFQYGDRIYHAKKSLDSHAEPL